MKALSIILCALILVSVSAYLKRTTDPLFSGPKTKPLTNPLNITSSCNPVNRSIALNRTILSGYLNVNKSHSNSSLYYIFYGAISAGTDNTKQAKAPLIIWLNGGPGSSSQTGNFFELGPFKLNKTENGTYEEIPREVNWNKDYNLLIIDQPIATGLSYAQNVSEIPKNQAEVAQHFYNALVEFYNLSCFANFTKTDTYLFGESYAGKYVPEISRKVLVENNNTNNTLKIPFRGSGFGDGFTHPESILSEVGMFAFNLGLIDFQERIATEASILKLVLALRSKQWRLAHDLSDQVWDPIVAASGNVNIYNYRIFGTYDLTSVNAFFNNSDIKKSYNIPQEITMDSGAGDVYEALYADFMQSSVESVEFLLAQKYQLLIYNGQDDLIVTNPGTMTWVDRLNWAGSDNFRNSDFKIWKFSNQSIVGYSKRTDNLELRIINKAGHFVPMDQPNVAAAMVGEFIGNCTKSIKK